MSHSSLVKGNPYMFASLSPAVFGLNAAILSSLFMGAKIMASGEWRMASVKCSLPVRSQRQKRRMENGEWRIVVRWLAMPFTSLNQRQHVEFYGTSCSTIGTE